MAPTRPRLRLLAAAVASTLAAAAPAATPAPAAAQSTLTADLLALLNGDRAAAGLAPLSWSGALAGIAESAPYAGCGFPVAGRAEDLIQRNYFAHAILGCGGRNVFAMMSAAGVPYSVAGENIGWTYQGDPAAVARWLEAHFMASPEHRANILEPRYTSVGIGSWATGAGQTWSGTGSPLSGVVVVAEEFAALPAAAPHVASRVAVVAPRRAAPAGPAPVAPVPLPSTPPPAIAVPVRPAVAGRRRHPAGPRTAPAIQPLSPAPSAPLAPLALGSVALLTGLAIRRLLGRR